MGNIRVSDQFAPSVAAPFVPRVRIPDSVGNGLYQGLNELASGVSALGGKIQSDQQNENAFKAQSAFIDATSAANDKFDQATKDAPPDAPNFTKDFTSTIEADHNQLLANLKGQGVDDKTLQDLQLKLQGLRSSIAANGQKFQDDAHYKYVQGQTSDSVTKISQQVLQNPGELVGALGELRDLTDAIPNITADQRAGIYNDNATLLKQLAGTAMAQQNPQGTIAALTAAPGSRSPTHALQPQVSGAIQEGAGNSSIPLSTLQAYSLIESGGDPNSNKGSSTPYKGLFQLTQKEFDENGGGDIYNAKDNAAAATRLLEKDATAFRNVFHRNPAPVELYLMHQQGVGGAIAHLSNPNGVAWQNMLKTGEGQEKGEAWAKKAIWGNIPDDVKKQFPGGVDSVTSGDFIRLWEQKVASFGGGGGTGDPVLDQLDGAQQLKALNQAQTQLNQNGVADRAQLTVDEANAAAAYKAGIPYAGNVPTEDRYVQAYGETDGPQKWAAFQGVQQQGDFVLGAATLDPQAMDQKLEALKPTDTSSPTFAEQESAYKNAVTARNDLVTQRQTDPVAYAQQYFPAVQTAYQAMMSQGAGSPQRQAYYSALNAAYDQLGIAPANRQAFPANAIGAMKDGWASLSPEQEVAQLAQLYTESGPLFQNALKQLGDNGKYVEAFVADAAGQNPGGVFIYADALRGIRTIAATPGLKPADAQVIPALSAAFKNTNTFLAIPPDSRQAIQELATGLYVQHGGDAKNVDAKTYAGYVRQLLGGDINNDQTGVVDLSKGKASYSTILPPGITSDDFKGMMAGAPPDFYSKNGNGTPTFADGTEATPAEIAKEGVFVRVGSNQFIITMSSDGQPLTTAKGGYYTVTLPSAVVKSAAALALPTVGPNQGPTGVSGALPSLLNPNGNKLIKGVQNFDYNAAFGPFGPTVKAQVQEKLQRAIQLDPTLTPEKVLSDPDFQKALEQGNSALEPYFRNLNQPHEPAQPAVTFNDPKSPTFNPSLPTAMRDENGDWSVSDTNDSKKTKWSPQELEDLLKGKGK